MSAKVKIKLRGSDAENFLSGNEGRAPKDVDRLNGDDIPGKKMMDENPESRQAENTHASEVSDITKKATKSTTILQTPEAAPTQGFELVKPVNRELPADYPERARRANNQSRDMRTNLGRGKPATVVQD